MTSCFVGAFVGDERRDALVDQSRLVRHDADYGQAAPEPLVDIVCCRTGGNRHDQWLRPLHGLGEILANRFQNLRLDGEQQHFGCGCDLVIILAHQDAVKLLA